MPTKGRIISKSGGLDFTYMPPTPPNMQLAKTDNDHNKGIIQGKSQDQVEKGKLTIPGTQQDPPRVNSLKTPAIYDNSYKLENKAQEIYAGSANILNPPVKNKSSSKKAKKDYETKQLETHRELWSADACRLITRNFERNIPKLAWAIARYYFSDEKLNDSKIKMLKTKTKSKLEPLFIKFRRSNSKRKALQIEAGTKPIPNFNDSVLRSGKKFKSE